ncbi:MAG: hypothetical protein WD055_00420 [Candidatus Dependentiae bacterium]
MKKQFFIICALSSSLSLFAIRYKFDNRTHRSLEPDKFAFWAIPKSAPPYLLVVVDPSEHASGQLPGDKVRVVYVIRDSFMQKVGNYAKQGAQAFEKAIAKLGRKGRDWEKLGTDKILGSFEDLNVYIYGPQRNNEKGTFTLGHKRNIIMTKP